ncbi:MAG: hypothetical protein IJX30_06285 [Clostridia bacterium]|nr:hypothetical protein [Clostridia bacterium]
MEKIIEKIFAMQLQTENLLLGIVDSEVAKREWEVYSILYEKLPMEEKKIFVEYTNLCAERHQEELYSAYSYGFKTATKLWMEGLKE